MARGERQARRLETEVETKLRTGGIAVRACRDGRCAGPERGGKGDPGAHYPARRRSVGARSADGAGRACRTSCVIGPLLLVALALAAPVQTAVVGPAGTVPRVPSRVFGHSVRDRPLVVRRLGDPDSARRVLVVGCIHGTECAGRRVTRHLAHAGTPRRFGLWLVHNLNPDGRALGVRQNGRGVDLNRNFPAGWIPIGRRWDPEYSGPRPFSEPESRAARDVIRRLRPNVTIWFHQPQALVRAWGRSRPAARRYARAAGVPYRSIRWPHGTASRWQNRRFDRGVSFVVELPPGRLTRAQTSAYAHAVRVLGRG